MNPSFSRTKIIATIGPASSSPEMLKKLVEKGVDVFRLNFSHGKHEDHAEVYHRIVELRKKENIDIAVLADLQGPKLRVGEMENNGVLLEDGAEFSFVTEKCMGTKTKAYMTYTRFPQDVEPGEEILIDDGKLKLRVTETNRTDTVKCVVVNGGILSSKKGVNLPDTKVSLPSLTEKDQEDLEFALKLGIDWVALSFVRTVTDIIEIKNYIKKQKKQAFVIAKIEKPEALKEIDNIIDMTDAIMVARGDLGVEVPFHEVPVIQKQIVEKCIAVSKPVIIATQMMESMITSFRPTRAEATDVANAVLEGADCLMLSGETSVGKYPAETIESMGKIIDNVELTAYRYFRSEAPSGLSPTFLTDSICYNACKLAEQSSAKAIITFTHSGYTAFKISGYRPKAHIIVFTSNRDLISRMALVWGIRAFYMENMTSMDDAIERSLEVITENNLIGSGDIVVHTGSVPLHQRGQTNMIKISYIK
jgi:pyruvate kinase